MATRQIKINTEEEIAQMREVGALAAHQMSALIKSGLVEPGVTTNEIDEWCSAYTLSQNCLPACLGYGGFPKTVCISPNHVVCHGIPSDKRLVKGDITNIDITIKNQDGWHGDTSTMFQVGPTKPHLDHLCKVAQEALYAGITAIKPGDPFNMIGKAIEESLTANHAKVFKMFIGHGINTVFHDEPQVLPYYEPLTKRTMEPGMIFTVEPIVSYGNTARYTKQSDGWTVLADDKRPNAQWEHTILVTETGYEILTWREDDQIDKIG